MFNYYFGLAVRSLKRNIVLTVLMIAAIGVGIGASMTTLTVFRAMDGDPIPEKSRQLFAIQIDNWGPNTKAITAGDGAERLQPQISYIDALALMNAHPARRQSAMYVTGAALTPTNADLLPFQVQIRAAYTDFFSTSFSSTPSNSRLCESSATFSCRHLRATRERSIAARLSFSTSSSEPHPPIASSFIRTVWTR